MKYWGMFFAVLVSAGVLQAAEITAVPSVKHEQRLAAHRTLGADAPSTFGTDYLHFKQDMQKEWGLSVGLDASFTAERSAPNGKQTAIQSIYYPYLTWNLWQDGAWGRGQINVNYNLIRYWGAPASALQNRTGQALAFNDYPSAEEFFSQASYTHTLPGAWDWLSVTVGQFPLYNFDGTPYLSNQQTALMNYALAQNASSVYPTAGFGAYVQSTPGAWSFSIGYQDASNLSGQTIRLRSAFDGHYTAFGSAQWNPKGRLGAGQYGALVYYQPAVSGQDEYSFGVSLNAQQNLGEKWAVFARANGASGAATAVKRSYAVGAAWLNPLERNAQDALIIGAAYNRLNGGFYPPAHGEGALEMQYIWGIGRFFTITPDIQFYPKTASGGRKSAAVFSLRTGINL